jgi:signal transduction histidine kinase/DNA-binding response OmpR family regulator
MPMGRPWAVMLALCAVLGASPANAQAPAARAVAAVPQFHLDTWTADEGLPSASITGIAQTTDGFIWLAAGGQLVRFDGVRFTVFDAESVPLLRARVDRVHVGVGDTLWISLDDGSVLSMAGGNFARLGRLPPGHHASALQQVQGSVLAWGTPPALWDGHAFRPIAVPSGWRAIPFSLVPIRDGDGTVWTAGRNGQVLRITTRGATVTGHTDAPRMVADPSRARVLFVHHAGDVGHVVDSAGTEVAAYRWNPLIVPQLIDRKGRFWATLPGEILVYLPSQIDPIARIQVSHQFETLYGLEDRAGDVWFGGAGLYRVREVPFRTITRLPGSTGPGRELAMLAPGPHGTLLAEEVRSDSGLYVMDGERVTRYRSGLATGATDARGTVWVLPEAGPATLTGERPGHTGIVMPRPAGRPLLLADDPSHPGGIWYGGYSVAYRVDPYADGGARIVDSVALSGRLMKLAVGRDGTMWAVSTNDAHGTQLVRYDGHTTRRWGVQDGLPSTNIRSLLPDSGGALWIGTYGSGLVHLSHDRFQSIRADQGLAEDIVSCVLDDGLGNLWMAGNRGVHRVSRAGALAYLNGSASRVYGVSYGRDDGIADPETTGDPCVRTGNGRLWFPTFGGVAMVDPQAAIALDSTPPLVHILGLRTSGDTLLPSTITRLPVGQRRIAIAYTGIAFREPEALRFEYRLDGVDNDWIYAGTDRVATYTDVGPGTHTFHLRAVNAGGVWSTADADLTFVVPPYFHETIPFYLILLALAGIVARLVWRARTAQLQHRQDELSATVDARTAELGRTLAVVEAQADQLRTLDEAKSRFFANVSHEFRTPLSLILGPVEDIREGRAGPVSDSARRRLGTVMANGQRLVKLVEQLLDVARLESGSLPLHLEVRDLVPLLRRVSESFASLAERNGIAFRVSCPVGGIRVRYDADHMEKVIGNLLGNALKFTPSRGRVELRARVEGTGAEAMAVVEVEDNGPGIPAEHQARVFDRFYQVDDSPRRAHEGAGIGLSLSREVVELHGGTLTLRSVEGSGSTFIVRLPVATGDAQPVVEPAGPRAVTAETPVPAAVGPAPKPGAADADDVTTVLVAEDNAELLAYLREHLADRYRVLEAANGARALELAHQHVPDLIVSDVMMPELDGQSLCEAIKRDAETDFIPVILLTAKASRESRLAGLEGGADDYLAKPVDMGELLVRAANLIASRRRLKERWQAERRELPTLPVAFHPSPLDAGSAEFLKRVYSAIAEHVGDEQFQVESLAATVNTSRSTLYRRVEALTGRPPMDVLWNYRLDQAAQWLTETDANVSEIAYGVGFKSVPHFCARFRERFGESPTGYRRTHRR